MILNGLASIIGGMWDLINPESCKQISMCAAFDSNTAPFTTAYIVSALYLSALCLVCGLDILRSAKDREVKRPRDGRIYGALLVIPFGLGGLALSSLKLFSHDPALAPWLAGLQGSDMIVVVAGTVAYLVLGIGLMRGYLRAKKAAKER